MDIQQLGPIDWGAVIGSLVKLVIFFWILTVLIWLIYESLSKKSPLKKQLKYLAAFVCLSVLIIIFFIIVSKS